MNNYTFKDKKIAFLCDENIPNYIYYPEKYNYITGKHSATAYYYWILKNFGFDNIFLVSEYDCLDDYDLVIFHYDNANCINVLKKYKTMQIVTDRPQVPNIDLYACCNLSVFNYILNTDLIQHMGVGLKNVLSGKLTYIPYPMTLNYKKCKASWPPKIYHFTGDSRTLLDGISSDVFVNHMKNKGVNLRFNFKTDETYGDEDVYFCVRRKTSYFSNKANGNNVDTKFGQITANRLYQSWKMGTPLIISPTSAMGAIYKSEYDFLIAGDLNELEYQSLRLLNDENLFKKMIENGNKRKDEHNNYTIVKHFVKAFNMIFH
jgi:hypothetical protein